MKNEQGTMQGSANQEPSKNGNLSLTRIMTRTFTAIMIATAEMFSQGGWEFCVVIRTDYKRQSL
jgi:hypothetical protein